MSFGYSVGDFLAVTAICWQAYKKCKDSTGEFREVAVEVCCLHNVLKETEEILSEQNLSEKERARLQPLKDGVLDLLKELERRLQKYESLGTQSMRTMDRIGWAMEGGVAGLTQRLISQTTLLDAFNNSASHARIERKLTQLVNEIQAGRRQGSVVSFQTFDGDNRSDWQALRRELEDIGISGDVIAEKRSFIIKWFQEAIAAGRLDEDKPDSGSEGEASSLQTRTVIPAKRKTSRLHPTYLAYKLRSDKLLISAAREGNGEKVEKLLEWGADVNYISSKLSNISNGEAYDTPLRVACWSGHLVVVRMLIDKGAYIDDRRWGAQTPLWSAVRRGNTAMVQLLINKGASMKENSFDSEWPPLQMAAFNGSDAIVQLLLDWGADVNEPNRKGFTALHRAVSMAHPTTARLLIRHGANVEAQTADGLTVRDMAVFCRRSKEIQQMFQSPSRRGSFNAAATSTR